MTRSIALLNLAAIIERADEQVLPAGVRKSTTRALSLSQPFTA